MRKATHLLVIRYAPHVECSIGALQLYKYWVHGSSTAFLDILGDAANEEPAFELAAQELA